MGFVFSLSCLAFADVGAARPLEAAIVGGGGGAAARGGGGASDDDARFAIYCTQ